MAYVAINLGLITDIELSIERMRQVEFNSEPEPRRPTLDLREPPSEWEFLSNAMWAPLGGTSFQGHPDLVWVGDNIEVKITITDRDGPDSEPPVNPCLSLRVYGAPKHATAQTPQHYDRSFSLDVWRADHPLFEEWSNWYAVHQEASSRWDKVAEQVGAFVKDCKSLNEALKLWPDLRRYCPRDALEKIDAVSERAKAKKEPSKALARLAEMDLDTIAASTVIARMVGGGS